MVTLEPNHVYVSGTLVLRPGVQFHLAGGSVLRASPSRDDFRALGALLLAKVADDLHVSGTGVIDGNFQAFFPPKGPQGYPVPQPFLGPYDPLLDASSLNPPDGRPRMILLVNCRRVLLEQFIIRDSPTWTIHPVGCEDLRISGLSILNNLDVPNCDGIDIDHCRRVHIEGCTIVAGDDCLVLKASRNFGQYGPCEGLTITNCTLESSSAAIKVEPEGPYPVRSAVVSNCSIVRSNRCISILNRDGATVEDLLFTDIVIDTKMRSAMWWGSGEPVAVSSLPRHTGGPAGLLRNVGFANLLCRGESGIYLRGANEAPLQDITFTRVSIAVEKTTPIQGGFYDMSLAIHSARVGWIAGALRDSLPSRPTVSHSMESRCIGRAKSRPTTGPRWSFITATEPRWCRSRGRQLIPAILRRFLTTSRWSRRSPRVHRAAGAP